jgi:uncharacterized protein YjgD (DUF1641 family)
MEVKPVANAITHIEKGIPDAAQEEDQAAERLMKAAVQHSDALTAFMGLLDEMHKLGVLDAAHAMLQNKQQIAVIGLNQLNKPGAHRIIKNAMGAVGFLSRLDPAKLQRMLNGVAEGVDKAGGEEKGGSKPAGLFGMLKSFREPEVLAAFGVLINFLRGMGKGLNRQPH